MQVLKNYEDKREFIKLCNTHRCLKVPVDKFKLKSNKLEKCQESLDQFRQKWADWIKLIQDACWKLDIPLNEYMRAFKKAEELYKFVSKK